MAPIIANEVKLDSDPCVIAWENKLFVGTEDGSIKCYDDGLTASKSWSAHTVQLFALAAGGGRVYSTSNDGRIRVWSSEGEKLAELSGTGADFGVLRVYGNELYAGDEIGNVIVYENYAEKARYNLLEEVKDLVFRPPLLYTVRDLDVTVTEIKPDESKNRFTMCHSMEGRAPLRLLGPHLLVIARDGNTLCMYDASTATNFKKLNEVKVSDMIITSLAASGDYVWTGGWDGRARRWQVAEDRIEHVGDLELGTCINCIEAVTPYTAYIGLAGGRLLRVVA